MQNHQLIVFSRAAVAGQVKKRIAKVLGTEKALHIHRQLFNHTIAVVKTSGIPYKLYLSGPAPASTTSYIVQNGADLGERMYNCFTRELGQAAKVCLIGSDCPELTATILKQAFRELASHDVVFGPAHDGGYYLIGMKAARPQLFTGINWGTATVLTETLHRCQEHKLAYALLPALHDVDRVEDIPAAWL